MDPIFAYTITGLIITFGCGCVVRMLNLEDDPSNDNGYQWENKCTEADESSAHRYYPASTAKFENLMRHRRSTR
jgi:hypothetical protein